MTGEGHAAGISAAAGLELLLRLKLRLLVNRVRQLADQSPLRLLMAVVFVAAIWGGLYVMFERVFVFLRRFEQPAVIAIPYVFHIFFVAMTLLLAFSTAVLVYGGLFGRAEPSFLLAMPHVPRNVVMVMYLEALFFASWSLILLGLPLMMAIGQVQGLPWHFYVTFVVAFLGFVPIPGALGMVGALAVALWLPRLARQTLVYATAAALALVVLWWGRLWAISSGEPGAWLRGFLAELAFLKAALLPSTWVTHAIRFAIEDRPADAVFYLGVTLSTALFFSWGCVNLAGRKLLPAFGRAQSASTGARAGSGAASAVMTDLGFFYLPPRMRLLILKDVRTFLRDPLQWSQLAILFGLLALYLAYLPRTRPEGFNVPWQALICFLNYGAVTLILSTFTSRFVFPMISAEGRQMWLLGLWPLARARVMWAKFLYALTVTGSAAMSVTLLSIRALDLPWVLAGVQFFGTFTTCIGLCGLAVGLGARMPSYDEADSGRIASGLGGTVNLIASVVLVVMSVGLVGGICYRLVQAGNLERMDAAGIGLFAVLSCLGVGAGTAAMRLGIHRFRRQEF
jgi:ABC-2 type transport system permease protein